jgi:tricorn protease
LTWSEDEGGYVVGDLILGDPWDAQSNSPLAAPGVDVRPGDVVVAINGQPLDRETGPAQLLINQAGQEVLVTLKPRPHGRSQGRNGQGEPAAADPAPEPAPSALPMSEPPAAPEEIEPPAANGDEPAESGAGLDLARIQPERSGSEGPAVVQRPRYRSVTVRTIADEGEARYRRWVETNRRTVHEGSGGRVGYVHVPDMGAVGYAEFHRGYLAEVDRDALIVDVRYNGGGHVSQLILEKLARRRLGYDLSRWGGLVPYPVESVSGPLVALTNEHAGSDGDVFCHSFKMMRLGPLVGKRTWGGVVGVSPRYALVDGTVTTQPEYGFWFEDVGWNVENYGTDPDIEVDITPQDYREGRDPQLARAVAEAMHMLESPARRRPEAGGKPSRALPKLPPRMPIV